MLLKNIGVDYHTKLKNTHTNAFHSALLYESKKKRPLSLVAIAFLLIIVLQYVENKMQIREMQRGELSMSFSNHGPLIKQLDCNCIITENKTNAVKYCYCLYPWSLKLSHFSNSLMSKCHEYSHPFLYGIAWTQAESMGFNKEVSSCWIQLKSLIETQRSEGSFYYKCRRLYCNRRKFPEYETCSFLYYSLAAF